MKKPFFSSMESELVATFGQARLVRHSSGRYELSGGRPEDHSEAREWISLFMHEALIDAPVQRASILRR